MQNDGSLAQLNRASDYGSEGCRFESCRSHTKKRNKSSDCSSSFLYHAVQVAFGFVDFIRYEGSPDKYHVCRFILLMVLPQRDRVEEDAGGG